MNKFAENLRRELNRIKMSQSELARRLGLSSSIINNYCAGKKEPTLDNFMRICLILEETADYMLGMGDVSVNDK